ncbi:MAG: M48 family metallopeptidase [Neisseriaceae bacterium]|nr:M48 family metallopeptidase [Neisseriaceae bacterium]
MDLQYLWQGRELKLRILRNAKKNIILRKIDSGSLKISVPKYLSVKRLLNWLDSHQDVIARVLQTPDLSEPKTEMLPEKIWFRGQLQTIKITSQNQFCYENEIFYVPHLPFLQQQQVLRTFLQNHAQTVLLNKLAEHANKMNLSPSQITLTNAKTFWGVCRQKTGIRLNWRLIGAPDFVMDYVCIHELCHLWHANHSKAFWQSVAVYCDDVARAKTWLKKHGTALFLLG